MVEPEDGMETAGVLDFPTVYGLEKVRAALFIETELKTILEVTEVERFLFHGMLETEVLR